MKKAARKLNLCRETLLQLEVEQLKAPEGATGFTWYCETGTNCQLSVCICQ